jgi:hypothetical protein
MDTGFCTAEPKALDHPEPPEGDLNKPLAYFNFPFAKRPLEGKGERGKQKREDEFKIP